MALWIAVLETDDGMWNDDPIGADCESEAERLAIEQWPKIECGERRAIYRCDYRRDIKTDQERAITAAVI